MNSLFEEPNLGKISDIMKDEPIRLYAKIDNLVIAQAANQTDYFNITLVDDSGQITAKKWNITENEKKQFKIGDVVYISGTGNEYNGKGQLIIEEMRKITEHDPIDIKDFYQTSPVPQEELRKNILSYIDRIKHPHLKLITKTLFEKYEPEYLAFPAASRNHHAYISGLSYHVSTMLNLAEAVSRYYPEINLDLLYSGIILHDIGKVIELSDYLSPEYTTIGKLIGHINIAFEEIGKVAKDLGIYGEEIMLLQHLVLSHHGLLEYGSPKRPQVLEAEVLHILDLLDSRLNMITQELAETGDSEFTKRIYPLEGRAFYKHDIK